MIRSRTCTPDMMTFAPADRGVDEGGDPPGAVDARRHCPDPGW